MKLVLRLMSAGSECHWREGITGAEASQEMFATSKGRMKFLGPSANVALICDKVDKILLLEI